MHRIVRWIKASPDGSECSQQGRYIQLNLAFFRSKNIKNHDTKSRQVYVLTP